MVLDLARSRSGQNPPDIWPDRDPDRMHNLTVLESLHAEASAEDPSDDVVC